MYWCEFYLSNKCLIYTGTGSLTSPDITNLGIPTIQEYVAEYYNLVGIPPRADLNIYVAFVFYRIAAILQGVYKRFTLGKNNNLDFFFFIINCEWKHKWK